MIPRLGDGAAHIRPQIINGNAAAGGFPWLAYVAQTDGSTYLESCTGTVVAPNWVLTAGHCLVDETTGAINPAANVYVVTGSADWTDQATRQISRVQEVLPDPRYDPATDFYDDGLVLLSTPTTAPALPLADGTDPSVYAPGSGVTISGWGLTDPNASGGPEQLQSATTVLQDAAYCASQYSGPFARAIQTCAVDAPYYDNGACLGDSGSPLIANYLYGQPGDPVEIGVLDTVPTGCGTDKPDVFTRASAIAAWVNSEIAAVRPGSGSTSPPTQSRPLRMTGVSGKAYAVQTLRGVFKTRYIRGKSYRTTCGRDTAIKFTCAVSWSSGSSDYHGHVDAWYVIVSGQVEWTDHYDVRWVSDHCYFHTGHRNRCRVSRLVGRY